MSETSTETGAGPLKGTVKVPGFGRVKTKTAVGVGGGAVVGMLLYFYIRQRRAAQAAANAAATSATSPNASPTVDPAGNTCDQSQINPATGYCLGSTQDLAATQQQSALQTAGEGGIYTGQPLTGGGGTPGGGVGFFANNAEWAQAVYVTLGSNGTDAIGQAVAAYLAGDVIPANEVNTINEAIAVQGRPPVAGPNGYPPAINTGPQPPPPKPKTEKVRVPSIVGDNVTNASSALQSLGLLMKPEPKPVKGKTHVVTSQHPKTGTMVTKGSTVTITYKTE